MPFRVRHSQRLFHGLFLITLAVLALIIRWHVRSLDSEVRREGLANATWIASRSVLVDHLDIETGLRGYLVAEQREYLRPYHEGLGRLGTDMAELAASVSRLPEERAHYDEIARESTSILSEFLAQISMVEREGIAAARARFLTYPTKPTMDRIRAHVTAIQAYESRRIQANMALLEGSMATTLVLIDVFTLICFVLLAALASGTYSPANGTAPNPEG